MSDLDEDHDHDEISACNNHIVEIEADIEGHDMRINRYKKLRQYLNFSDNSKIDDAENKKSKLYKIQPVIDHMRNKCHIIKPEIENSIDEQIIPAKTKYSGIKQYNPKKPLKWGFKILFVQDNWV